MRQETSDCTNMERDVSTNTVQDIVGFSDNIVKNNSWTSNKIHSPKKPVTTMLTYPWKCTVLHCNHPENTWKPLVLMTRHFDYCPSVSESSAPVVSRCFPGGYNVKLYISKGGLAWWLLAFLHSDMTLKTTSLHFKSTLLRVYI